MKRSTLLLGFLVLLFTACGDGTLSVEEYNQKATTLYNALDARFIYLSANLLKPDGTMANNEGMLAETAKKADSVRAELGRLRPCKDAEALHRSLLAVVDYEKDRMIPAMRRVMSQRDNPEALSRMVGELNTMETESRQLLAKMHAEQQAMAAKAGATLN